MKFEVVSEKPEEKERTVSMWLEPYGHGIHLYAKTEEDSCCLAWISENGIQLHPGVDPEYGIALDDGKIKIIS